MAFSWDQIRWGTSKPPRGSGGQVELPLRVVVDWKVGGGLATFTDAFRWYNDTGYTLTIKQVRITRRTAGSSGQTVVDVNKNGTTIYTTQANRPTVTAAAGNQATHTGGAAPDVGTVAAGSYLDIAVDEVEVGSPADLIVQMTLAIE